jgi:putative transposase
MAHQAQYPARAPRRILKVSPSGYYAWRDRPPSPRAMADGVTTERICSIHAESDSSYGMPRDATSPIFE